MPQEIFPAAFSASNAMPMSPHAGQLCVAIQAPTAAELIARAQAAVRDSKFLEFRLDSVDEPVEAIGPLRAFLAQHPTVTAIGTCRRLPGGGGFAGSVAEELAVLGAAAEAGCKIVDLEIETAEETTPVQMERFRVAVHVAGAQLLISSHDFSETRRMALAADRIAAFRPEIVKVVSTARSLADNLEVLRLIRERAVHTRIVGIAMSEEGLVSRVLGPREGALFTFAAPDQGQGTAPGQVTVRTLRELYHIERINQETRIFGVAGNPIGHSLSPLMHNAAYRAEGVNAVMFPLKVNALSDLLTLVAELPMAGVAVTMPLKQEVLPHLAQMDPLVERIGACNTLRASADGKLYGFNTDVAGVVRPLERRIQLKGARVAVLGAGGAARAAVFGLVEAGAEVFIVNRTHETAEKLAAQAGAQALEFAELAEQKFDVLLNTTPCGMKGVAQQLPIAEDQLNAELVFDMVYNPLETPLLKLAAQRGLATIGGMEMFVQQGARQFEIWTGKPAPEAEMRRVVELALSKRA
jgi:3-dehydroquinate dehydratase/shikimate dehydrogenase